MPFVQGCGGQVNASTRERDSYFFFEVPAGLLDDALARLVDMAARPLLEPAAQLQEREIVHAEFLARAQDADTLCDAALAQIWDGAHPCLDFHAGNRDSLPVEQPAFQRALRGFHQSFYHAGQATLVLVGPQPTDELRRLAQIRGGTLAPGLRVAQHPARSLLPLPGEGLRVQVAGVPRLSLFFVLEGLPAAADQALEFFSFCLEAGELRARLRALGWCDGLRLRVPYRHAGQALLAIDFDLCQQGADRRAEIAAAFFDWLGCFAAQGDWAAWRAAYRRSLAWRLQAMEPLALARYLAERLPPGAAWASSPGLSGDGLAALPGLLTQLRPAQMLPLTTAVEVPVCPTTTGFPVRALREAFPLRPFRHRWDWPALPSNAFLQEPVATPALAGATHGGALRTSPDHGLGALFLRWGFAEQPAPGLWHALNAALRDTGDAARQAAVEVRFEDCGGCWQLSLSGPPEPQSIVLAGVLDLLVQPPAEAWQQGLRLLDGEARRAGGEPLIHRLWRELPRLLERQSSAHQGVAAADWPQALSRLWGMAHWHGLAFGWTPSLAHVPGQPAPEVVLPQYPESGYRWRDSGIADEQCALLLFCPLPQADARTEAAWRLLAQLYEPAFFRRLRSELQLGYAVFSGFRRIGGHRGLLFAVQSPTACAGEILRHIEAFLDGWQTQLLCLPSASLHEQGRALSLHLAQAGSLRKAADQTWLDHLAGCPAEHQAHVRQALATLQRDDLLAQHSALREARGGWWVLANAAPTDPRWLAC